MGWAYLYPDYLTNHNHNKMTKLITLMFFVLYSTLALSQSCPQSHTTTDNGDNTYEIIFDVVPFPGSTQPISIDLDGDGVFDCDLPLTGPNQYNSVDINPENIIFIIMFYSEDGMDSLQCFYLQALPVDMEYFLVESIGEKVLLKWQTQSEHNNEGFYVLHNGKRVDFIQSLTAHGAVVGPFYYEVVMYPSPENNYYAIENLNTDSSVDRVTDLVHIFVPIEVTEQFYSLDGKQLNREALSTFRLNNKKLVILTE